MNKQHRQKKDASYLNKLNKIEVLGLIRKLGETSRADIVKKTKLSAPTVTRIVDSLISSNLVSMVGKGDSTGGRPPKVIKFDGSHNYVIGIDLGATNIRAGLSDLEGLFINEIQTSTDIYGGIDKICEQIGELSEKLIIRSKIDKQKVLGIGLAVAGLINSENGIIEYSPLFNWSKVDLREELSKHISFPIYYDNVSRVTAFGELLNGVGKKYRDFICVNVAYGIGAGIIIGGKPFYGSQGFAGELGHVVVDQNSSYTGKDGIRGCLEALSSGYGIAEITKYRLSNDKNSKSVLNEIENITAKIVVDAAKAGDELAIEIFNDAMQHLGVAIDMLIKLFDPKVIVFSGGLTKSGDIFFEKLSHAVMKNKLVALESDNETKLLPSSFREDAALIGAISLIISRILQFENDVHHT